MESQQQNRDESLLERNTTNGFSSGTPADTSADAESEDMDYEDQEEDESASDDEMEEDL